MKYLKMFGLVAMAAMALSAFVASAASATTLEKSGVTQIGAVEITASLEPSTSAVLQKTDGSFANTCKESHVFGTTTVFSGTAVSGPITTLTFNNCTTEKVEVDAGGSLSIERIGTTTDGTVKSSGAKVTVPSPFGKLTCVTGTGVDIGTLTGVTEAKQTLGIHHATMDIHAVLDCGFLAPSATWDGFYTVTTPTDLGVTS